MSLKNVVVLLMVSCGLILSGCKKEEPKKEEAPKVEKKAEEPKPAEAAKPEEKKAEEAKPEEKKAEEPKPAEEQKPAEEKKEEPKPEEKPAEPAPAAGADPKATVEGAVKALQAKDFNGLVALFPPKYMKDLDTVVQEFGKAMDKELFDKFVGLVDRAITVAVAQKAAVAKAVLNFGVPAKEEDIVKAIDSVKEVWDLLKGAGLTDLEKLKAFSFEAFVKDAAPKVWEKSIALADATQKAQIDAALAMLGAVTVEVVSNADGKAELKVGMAGQEPEAVKLALVDGKWVPEEMAAEWDKGIAEAIEEIKKMGTELPNQKAQIIAQLDAITPVLDQIEKTGDLNAALQALGMGAMAPAPAPAGDGAAAPAEGAAPAPAEGAAPAPAEGAAPAPAPEAK